MRHSEKEGFTHSYRVDLLLVDPFSIDQIEGFEQDGPRFVRTPDSTREWRIQVERSSRALDSRALAIAERQSWSWTDARYAASQVTHAITIRDVRPGETDPRERVAALNAAIADACLAIPTIALLWHPTEQLVEPAGFRNAYDVEGTNTLYGAVNVRLFRLERYEDDSRLEKPETIMDSLGLAAIGLDDFQLHFRDLDPAIVGDYLYRLALQTWSGTFNPSPGSSLSGANGEEWHLELEEALVPPERVVFDIHTHEQGLAGRT